MAGAAQQATTRAGDEGHKAGSRGCQAFNTPPHQRLPVASPLRRRLVRHPRCPLTPRPLPRPPGRRPPAAHSCLPCAWGRKQSPAQMGAGIMARHGTRQQGWQESGLSHIASWARPKRLAAPISRLQRESAAATAASRRRRAGPPAAGQSSLRPARLAVRQWLHRGAARGWPGPPPPAELAPAASPRWPPNRRRCPRPAASPDRTAPQRRAAASACAAAAPRAGQRGCSGA